LLLLLLLLLLKPWMHKQHRKILMNYGCKHPGPALISTPAVPEKGMLKWRSRRHHLDGE
jgi:hypothetical protein